MTTRAQALAAIFGAFRTAWGTETVFALGDNDAIDTAAEWCRVSLEDEDSRQETLGPPGARQVQRFGTLRIEIRLRQGTGEQRADDLLEILKGAYEMKTLGGVAFLTASLVARPSTPPWSRVAFLIPFYYFEHK